MPETKTTGLLPEKAREEIYQASKELAQAMAPHFKLNGEVRVEDLLTWEPDRSIRIYHYESSRDSQPIIEKVCEIAKAKGLTADTMSLAKSLGRPHLRFRNLDESSAQIIRDVVKEVPQSVTEQKTRSHSR